MSLRKGINHRTQPFAECESGKICFVGQQDAVVVAAEMDKQGAQGEGLLNVYFHGPCGYWHIGRLSLTSGGGSV